ncbi:MAG: GerAB/ArcD/ProY family transporter [Firmicutes bacterium]|nr:GerAB/ArcD/ProY family transporter [Bacillota bacterium]
MKKISTRQLIIFFCIYSFSIKFLSLPMLLSQGAGRDAWITAAVGSLVELLVLFAALNIIMAGRDSDSYSDLRKNITGIGAKIIVLGMLFVFMLQLLILTQSTFALVSENLFTDFNIHKFMVPLMLLGILFCFVPARAIFRGGEVFWLLIIIGVVLSVLPVITQMKVSEVTPVMQHGLRPILTTLFRNMIYFESAAFLFIFSGDVEIKKDFRKKFMGVAAILAVFFVFFVFMFTALFGPLASYKTVAVANLTVYSAFLTQGGRLDWLLICIWLLLLLVRFGVTFYCAFASVRYIFNVKHRAGYIGFGIAVLLYALYYFVFINNDVIGTLRIPIFVLYFAIPFVFIVCALLNKKRGARGTPTGDMASQKKEAACD